MKFTVHAAERINGRTKMYSDDVLSILAAGATVYLGSDGNTLFFLFYSPPDKECKIALVREEHLISIWEKGFALPGRVRRVSSSMESRARKLLETFIYSRIKEGLSGTSRYTHVSILVYVGGKFEYEHRVGERNLTNIPRAFEHILVAMMPDLIQVAKVVEEHAETDKATVSYRIILSSDSRGAMNRKTHYVKHEDVMKRMVTGVEEPELAT